MTQFDIVNMVYSMALAGPRDDVQHDRQRAASRCCVTAISGRRSSTVPISFPNAVEEILRFDGPVLNHRRVAKVDTEIDGVLDPGRRAGDAVLRVGRPRSRALRRR